MPKFRDLTGEKFGRWTVLKWVSKKYAEQFWLCKCDCGAEKIIIGGTLKSGRSKSCGCYSADITRKHGMEGTAIYNAWAAMIQRCTNPKNKFFSDYGDRGITVCDEWLEFKNFYADMGDKPEGMSLDRIDNNGNYEKSNCKWSIQKEQIRNRRVSPKYEFNGEIKPLGEWCEIYNLPWRRIYERMRKGWTIEKALTEPIRKAKTMKIETICNTPDNVLFENIKINSARKLHWISQYPKNDLHAVIVGGGASVKGWIEEVRLRQEHGQTIFALNGAAKWLHEHGIIADYCVIVDARQHNIEFVNYANIDLLASQCHPDLFETSKAAGLWHQEYPDNMPEFEAALPDTQPEHTLIGGGTTVGLSAMVIAYALGYRCLHLYGYDSSYTDDNLHAWKQDDPQRVICDVTVAGKTFKTTLAMAKQAELFPQLSDSLIDLGCTITIRGDGLLPWTSKMSTVPPEKITEQEKYQKMWAHNEYRQASPGESRVSLFLLAANPHPSDTVIDFGAGTGRAALRIQKMRLCNVLMLDFADNCLDDEVRANIGDKLRFNIADLTQPINHHAKYGYCTDVLEHIPPEDVETVIKNIMNAADNVFFQISTIQDSMGVLIGQHLHLTVEDAQWWKDKFTSLGYTVQWDSEDEISVLLYVTQLLEGTKNA